jgi:carbon storage regulator
MLVLTRRIGEKLFIGDDIEVIITDIDRGKVRIGISAPAGVRIDREEIRRLREAEFGGGLVEGSE